MCGYVMSSAESRNGYSYGYDTVRVLQQALHPILMTGVVTIPRKHCIGKL